MVSWNNAPGGSQYGWGNLLSNSCGGNCNIPTVNFHPIRGIRIVLKDEKEFGNHKFDDQSISHVDWTKIQISQEIESTGQIVHRLTINGVEKGRLEVQKAREITNLEVYASGPHHKDIPDLGYMKGLSIQIWEVVEELQQRISHRDL